MVNMNQDINEAIDAIIEQYGNIELTENFDIRDRHYLIEGMKICQQIATAVGEVNVEEIAYEKFEELVKLFKSTLPQEEFEEILNAQLKEVKTNE